MKYKYFVLTLSLVFLLPNTFFSQEKELDYNALDYIEASDADGDVMSLREIDKLIKQTDYNKALIELHKYIEKYPDRFDNAQRLIKIIMTRRMAYSELAEKAIKSSTENPEDHETVAKIILEMKSLEKKPPEEIKDLVELLEDMHLFKYYAYLFDTIQKNSSEITQKGRREESIKTVQEGFWVYKDEFNEDWAAYPNLIKQTDSVTEKLNGYIGRIQNPDFTKRYNNAVAEFIKNVNEDKYDAALVSFVQAKQVMDEYADLRNKILECNEEYKTLYQQQKRINPQITDASYLSFMQRFITGIPSIPHSGIKGALDYEWENNYLQMKKAVAKMTNKYVSNYLVQLPKSVLGGTNDLSMLKKSGELILPLRNYCELGKNVNKLNSAFSGEKGKADTAYNDSLDFINNLTSQTDGLYPVVEKLNLEIAKQNQLRKDLKNNKKKPDYDSSTIISELFNSVSNMDKITGPRSSYTLKVENGLKNNKDDFDWNPNKKVYDNYITEIFDRNLSCVTSTWSEISQSFIDDASVYENIIKEYNQYANVFSNGFTEKIDDRTYERIRNNPALLLEYAKTHENAKPGADAYKYPNFTISMVEQARSVSVNYEETMKSAVNEFDRNINDHPEWKTNRQISDIVTKSQTYIEKKNNELATIKQTVNQVVETSQKQLELAKENREAGDKLYNQALSAFNESDYEKSSKLLSQSGEKYSESLGYCEDPELRKLVDRKNKELADRIIDANNEVVVRLSRELYNKAVSAQNRDEYDQAEIYINSAIDKWSETHSEPNDEFETLRAVINTAVSMKTGRILFRTDPLYTEMSQLLNFAYQYYDEGSALYKNNKPEEGNVSLNLALENLRKIKKVYPINQEASILMLKIDQLQDPVKFEEEFAQKIKDSIAKCKKPETQTEGYNDLINYYNINPGYKGLKKTIDDIEISLGMKQKPVDNSAVTRASKLVTEAQNLFNTAGNDQAKLNRALSRVNEALRLNPGNKTAQNLKDRISTKIGGSAVISISTEDLALLNKAKSEYQAGRIDAANIIMIQILKNNPQNAKVKAVADLKKKIDARL